MTRRIDPVKLDNYNPLWVDRFNVESVRLNNLLTNCKIEHIGSTAIPEMKAKPIVDILVGIPRGCDMQTVADVLTHNGYEQEGVREGHIWLASPSANNRQFIVHIVYDDGSKWRKRLLFRDCLRKNTSLAREYEGLKISLATKHNNSLAGYTATKADFVERVISLP